MLLIALLANGTDMICMFHSVSSKNYVAHMRRSTCVHVADTFPQTPPSRQARACSTVVLVQVFDGAAIYRNHN